MLIFMIMLCNGIIIIKNLLGPSGSLAMSWEHVLFVLFVAVCTVKSAVCTGRLSALISSLSVPAL